MKGLKLFISSSLFIISIISGEEIAEVQPSQPLNVTILRVTSTTIYLSWSQPEKPNGQIQGYRLYYMHAMQTHVRSVRNTTASIQFELEHLEPFTEYKIWLKAFTEKHEGLSSEAVLHRTDVRAPSAPTILNLTCQAHDSVLLQWQQPLNYSVSIDYYYITYRDENENNAEEIEVESSKEHLDSTIMIHNLTGNTVYEIKVRAASRSVFDPKVLINGEESQPKRVEIRNDCDQIVNDRRSSSRELSAGMIAGVVCASCSLLLACASFILWRYYLRTSKHERQFFLRQSLLSSYTSDSKKRKCFHAPYYYLDEPPRQSNALVDWDTRAEPGAQKSSVPVHLFSKHVASLHADGDIGFSKEYEAIQSTSTQDEHTSEHSHHPDNKQKNRYLNILAYDHSRVQLLPVPGQKKSIDYVNANYIDGFQRSRAYIGTQGPLPSTFDCFWRMVWEQRVVIIVMITNLVERGRRKCDMYWPKEGIETYGVIQVKLVKEDVMATYTVRTLQIRHLRIRKKKSSINDRIVYQYHYTNWPDHGTPDHPLPVLSFVKKSSAANPTDAGPIIVHCSAGVGRTGTYIVLDSMLKQIRCKGEVNIFGFLRHIRSQRNFLVQTEEQYIFIHDALLEAIESGETNINQSYIGRYINNLQIQENLDEKVESWKLLETQFKNVISFQPKDFNLVSANKSCNQVKNRILDILPIESSRVHLTPKPGIDGSDYVNASWFQGFHKLREFIITQHPLEVTVLDFWQMIWDHNAQTIVLLSSIENEMDQEFKVFWPTENDDLNGENFKVKFIDERDHSTYSMKDLTIHSLQDDYEFSIKLVHYPNWPHIITPNNSVFDLLKVVQDHHSINPNGPIIVMDRFGGTEAASFCCLTTLSKQMEYENHVDVYMYAKLYHNKRPGIWKTQDDYLLLYRWLEAISISKANATPPAPSTAPPDLYLTANGHLNDFHGNGNVRTCIIEMDDSSSTSPKFTN